jgi:hypothetical protein
MSDQVNEEIKKVLRDRLGADTPNFPDTVLRRLKTRAARRGTGAPGVDSPTASTNRRSTKG